MSKITDLKREVKKRLHEKNIVDLSQIRLKPIDVGPYAYVKDVTKNLEKAFKKIGEKVFNQVFSSEGGLDEKIREINKLLDGEIKVAIETTHSSLPKKLVSSFTKGEGAEDVYFLISLKEDDTIIETFSSLNFEPTKKQEGIFNFVHNRSERIPFISFKKLIGMIYFYNNLRKYIKYNQDVAMFLMIKFIKQDGVFKDREYKEEVEKLGHEYGLSFESLNDKKFINEFSKSTKNIIDKYKRFDYLDWINNKNFFLLNGLFNYSYQAEVYELLSIKEPKLAAYFLNFLYELNVEEERDVKEEHRIASDYASSFETKKNIPQKVLDKMNITSFKTHFGYVEFDELVDLDKVEIVEKEWEDINKKIAFPIAKDHSLRFRRLGRHKAAGLYFSGAKAVCVDISNPSSMVHEVFHMIDFTSLPNTNLSSLYNFRSIVERYRHITDKKVDSLPDDNSYKIMWNSKNKYNKDYFQSSKEIFARCGEIYISKILGIDSSLVKTGDSLVYPVDDEMFMDLIKNYYSTIVQVCKEDIVKEEMCASPNILSRKEVELILKNNQISIFDVLGGGAI